MKNDSTLNHRLVRLFQLIQELDLNPAQKPQELWERLGIGKSAFYKDLKLLAEAGFSWSYNKHRQKFVREGEGVLPTFSLTLQEAIALILAVRQFAASGDTVLAFDAIEGIKKLISVAPLIMRPLLQGALTDILAKQFKAEPKILDRILEAQRLRREVKILYDDQSRRQILWYRIAPYQIFFQARALYLDVLIPEEHRIATLRFGRIKEVGEPGPSFDVIKTYNFTERHRYTFRAFQSEQPPQTVKLRFEQKVARYILESEWHSTEKKIECSDGGVILTLQVAYPREVLWYLVMPYAEHASILEPAWLKEEFVRIAHAVINKHQPLTSE